MRKRGFSKMLIYAGIFVAIIAAALYLATIAIESNFIISFIQQFGYVGIFAVAIITGFNLVVPIPPVALFPLFIESGLNFWGIILATSIGLSIADSISYFLGKAGREIVVDSGEHKVITRLERIRSKYEYAPLAILFFVATLAPFPNELVVIPLAFLGYRLRLVLPILFAGHLIFHTIYATGIINFFNAIAK